VTLRDGRFGTYVQLGEGEKPKRQTIPKGTPREAVTLELALKLLSLPREVARHPTSGEPIVANIGRFGPYVQHGKVFANIGKDDDVLEIGPNRAIDLIVAKESGGGRFGRQATPGRVIGDHPEGGPVTVRDGKYGPYVNHGAVNATLPKGVVPDSLTLEQAIELLKARAEAGGGKKSTARRGAKPAAKSAKPAAKAAGEGKAPAKKAATKKPAAKKAAAKKPAAKAPPAARKAAQ
jgi:DNA topoisomerase-1